MPSSLIDDLVRQCEDITLPCPVDELPGLPTLVETLAAVPDHRSRSGRRYRLSFLLATSLVAVLSGARSLTAIAQWAKTADPMTIGRLGGPHLGRPADTTLARAIDGIDADALDDACFGWINALLAACEPDRAAPVGLAVDGKTVRGAIDAEGKAPHLVAAVRHDTGTVAGQRTVAAKTNEINAFAPLLDTIDITGLAVTADALHTQRKHARYLRGRGAFYIFYVMGNQPGLFDTLDLLPWEQREPDHTEVTIARGRITTRTIRVLPAPRGLRFPDAAQVFLIERQVTDLRGHVLSCFAVLGLTSLTADHATPAELATLVRGHWKIENGLSDCAYG